MEKFNGLTQDCFDTYAPEKWSSHVHNLARMRVKETMLALCDRVQRDLKEELAHLSRNASDEIPNISNKKKVDAQWVYWFRNPESRKELATFLSKTTLDESTLFNIAGHDKHITLNLVLGPEELWLGVRIAPGASVDRRNLAAILEKSWERERLFETIKALPDETMIGQEGALVAVEALTLDQLEKIGKALGPSDPSWLLGHATSAEEAIALGKEAGDHFGRWLQTVLPVYQLIAWKKENDHIGATREIQKEKAQKRKQATAYRLGDEVRVISGIFAGKSGVVQAIDAKAQVKIRVGTMSVVVDGTDLTPFR